MGVNDQLGPSRRKKDANKGYIDWTKLSLGTGLTFVHQKPDGTKISDPDNVPWGDIAEDEVVLSIDDSVLATDANIATVSGDIISYVNSQDSAVLNSAVIYDATVSGDIISYVNTQDDSHQAAAQAYTDGRLNGWSGTATVSGGVFTVVSGIVTNFVAA